MQHAVLSRCGSREQQGRFFSKHYELTVASLQGLDSNKQKISGEGATLSHITSKGDLGCTIVRVSPVRFLEREERRIGESAPRPSQA